MVTDGWTIDELAARVAAALDDCYPGAPNGRVRGVPDARAIRWYATIGLVDRPAVMRGRTALYGERHLLQLVAVKRRQAQGRSIAEIQAELAGASEATLRELAGVSDEVLTSSPTRPARFWTERPAPAADQGPPRRSRANGRGSEIEAFALDRRERDGGRAAAALLTGVPLEGGVVVLVPAVLGHEDLDAIAVAARPLLDLLSARGLLRSER